MQPFYEPLLSALSCTELEHIVAPYPTSPVCKKLPIFSEKKIPLTHNFKRKVSTSLTDSLPQVLIQAEGMKYINANIFEK